MKKLLYCLLLTSLIISPFPLQAESTSGLSEEEREILIEEYEAIRRRLDYLKWYIEKFEIEKKIGPLSYLVYDIQEEKTLLKKNDNHSYPIASITKVMSAVVTQENIDINQKITLTSAMFLPNSWQRQSPAIYAGTTLTAGDLMKASLIQSTNNAVHSLTHFLNEGEFLKKMNETAKAIGMKNTQFFDAHGISSLNRSTAPDILKLMTYVSKNHPEILEITKEENFQLPGKCPEYNWICTFKNLNLFHEVDNFVGGKTGFTNKAGNTFAGVFDFDGRRYSIVLLNTKSRTADTQKISEWLSQRP